MPLDEKIRQNEFEVVTRVDDAVIREAGRSAAERAKRFLGTSVAEGRVGPTSVEYRFAGPGRFIEQMAAVVEWTVDDAGDKRVRLRVGDYLTVRSTYMFIPVSPKRAPALPSLRTFSEALRAALVS